MQHKISIALQELPEIENIYLCNISIIKELADEVDIKLRKHWIKTVKHRIKGTANASHVNSAKPDSKETKSVYKNYIKNGTVVLFDEPRNYIKQHFGFYSGVTSPYLNRYNTLLAVAYQNVHNLVNRFKKVFFSVDAQIY